MIHIYACGASVFGKPAKFRMVLKQSGLLPGQVICIGDEIRDHEAARGVGLNSGLVGWGFTNSHALRALQPDHMFSDPRDVMAAFR